MTDLSEGSRNPDALIRRAGIKGDPNADQHFLVDDRVIDRIPSYAPSVGSIRHTCLKSAVALED